MTETLNQTQIQASLAHLPNWNFLKGELVRTTTFDDFKQAMAFINCVADMAEAAGHHPDIDIRYNKVRLALVTHDAGGITQNDIDLAQAIETMG
jgi:4a-hydroxytetrahydrobiopterin dehydratase